MAEVLYTQWRNANEQGKYPFSTRASLSNGSVSISEKVFIDANLYAPAGRETQFLSKIIKTATELEIIISDTYSGQIAHSRVVLGDISSESVELLEVRDNFEHSAGVLVTAPNRLGLLTALPLGEHEFTYEQTEFSASVITPLPQDGLRSISVDGEEVNGDVWLVGGLGVVLEHEYVDGEDRLVMNAVGEPLSKRTVCQDESIGFTPPGFLSTLSITGGGTVAANSYGDMKIAPCAMDVDDTVLRVLPEENGITFGVVGGRIGDE